MVVRHQLPGTGGKSAACIDARVRTAGASKDQVWTVCCTSCCCRQEFALDRCTQHRVATCFASARHGQHTQLSKVSNAKVRRHLQLAFNQEQLLIMQQTAKFVSILALNQVSIAIICKSEQPDGSCSLLSVQSNILHCSRQQAAFQHLSSDCLLLSIATKSKSEQAGQQQHTSDYVCCCLSAILWTAADSNMRVTYTAALL